MWLHIEVSHLFVLCLISQSTKMMKLLNQGSQQGFYLWAPWEQISPGVFHLSRTVWRYFLILLFWWNLREKEIMANLHYGCLLLILGRYKMSTEFRLLKLHHIHPSRRVNKFIKGNQNPKWCHRTGIILRMLLECLIPAESRSDESPWSTARLPLPEPATSD